MTDNELINEYFEWMYQLVCTESDKRLSFRKLLGRLYDANFEYTFPIDGNRESDGIHLRYRFGEEFGYDRRAVASVLDNRPCSILEMMIALSLRCEEFIMIDSHYGNRTGQWFWNMINSLGLGGMTDEKIDRGYVTRVIDRFNDRQYEPNGHGSLFQIHDKTVDMRKLDIWYQMQAYLNDILEI